MELRVVLILPFVGTPPNLFSDTVTTMISLDPEDVSVLHAKILEEVTVDRMLGPFDTVPAPLSADPSVLQPRICPLFSIPKNEYDLLEGVRLISDFSAAGPRRFCQCVLLEC